MASALRAEGSLAGGQVVLDLVGAVRSELTGAGPLDGLLADPEVSDVLVNGPSEVWLDRGHGLERAAVRFRDEAAVRRLAQRLAASAGRRLDVAAPTVDARLLDGTRLHAVLPPVAPGGTLISLRVSRRRTFTVDDLVARATLAPVVAEVLRRLVRARRSFLVTGAPAPARRRCSRHCCPRSSRPSGSCSSRTPASCGRITRTWCALRRASPTSRAGRGRPAHAGPAGAPDASRPAGRR